MGLSEIEKLRTQTPKWRYEATENELIRIFQFKNYHQTIDFVNKLADVVHKENHHPVLQVSYNHCRVSFKTHSVNGITENDFICAAKIDVIADRNK